MAFVKIDGVRVSGIAAAVPERVQRVSDLTSTFSDNEINKISTSTGVKQRHEVDSLCASDLCFSAAESLIAEMGMDKEEIDALVFVSQTSDYILPATSCTLHGRLGLSKKCLAFDINLGCSGYVYGLYVVSSLIASGGVKKVLLLAGDTISKITSPKDRSVSLLFGDAGSATCVEKSTDDSCIDFVLGTDGKNYDKLKIAAGGFREPLNDRNTTRELKEDGSMRARSDLYMNGPEVFAFTLSTVPKMIKELLSNTGRSIEDHDAIVMHQANKFILEHLGKRLKIPKEKLVLGLEQFGNTSCASIPLAVVTELKNKCTQQDKTLLFAGFGVGLSWAAASLECKSCIIPALNVVNEQDTSNDQG